MTDARKRLRLAAERLRAIPSVDGLNWQSDTDDVERPLDGLAA